MAMIRPFQALRPRAELAPQIAALPYDVYSREEARQEVLQHPRSFLKIDRAETQMDPETDLYALEVYEKAAETLREMIENGSFQKEQTPCLYVYELTMNGRRQTGLGACVSVEEYENNKIKKHENTRKEKEEDRVRHVAACQAQTGPIFLAYRQQREITELQEQVKKQQPLYDFVSEDGIGHRMWAVDKTEMIEKFQRCFDAVAALYIADGHHRAASAVRVAKMRRNEEEKPENREKLRPEYEDFLAVLFADQELLVMDYNRWVKDLHGYTPEAFLEKLKESFSLQTLEEEAHPERKGQFTMYLDGNWYLLWKKEQEQEKDVVEALDVSILQREILAPILGIEDPKTDSRISFVGGIRGLKELERLVDQKGGVAFAMYPTAIEELMAVADAGKLMPPKSTWFEPKLRSGLLIHQI